MINILHAKFKSQVLSNCISEDDYSVTNLVTSRDYGENPGFMAYKVTKPPVEIIFKLSKAIDVRCVKIWTRVGSLKSTGFEIYAQGDSDYVKIGRCNDLKEDIVIFERKTSSSQGSHVEFFSSREVRKALSDIKCMKIIITRTKNCAPVIKRVEIWGLPICKSPRSSPESKKFIKSASKGKCDNENLQKPIYRTNEKNFEIPEEFLDSITCEIMTFPMVLPSGKIVDQSTIEKHSDEESKWGRQPSDPFTGTVFSNYKKPVFNATLKSHIDNYLIRNSNRKDIMAMPRTLATIAEKRKLAHLENLLTVSSKKAKLIDAPKQNLNTSLNLAVEHALKSVTRFSKGQTLKTVKANNFCDLCNLSLMVYKISTCKHKLCKPCMKKLVLTRKCFCHIKFKSQNVERIYKQLDISKMY